MSSFEFSLKSSFPTSVSCGEGSTSGRSIAISIPCCCSSSPYESPLIARSFTETLPTESLSISCTDEVLLPREAESDDPALLEKSSSSPVPSAVWIVLTFCSLKLLLSTVSPSLALSVDPTSTSLSCE